MNCANIFELQELVKKMQKLAKIFPGH